MYTHIYIHTYIYTHIYIHTYIYTGEEGVMHSKSNNIEIMIYDKAEKIIKEFFQSILCRYQRSLAESTKVSYFVFNYVYYTTNVIK